MGDGGDGLDRFDRVKRVRKQGGQGDSYQARDRETGEFVFVKELKRSRRRNLVARKRFRREVAAYETVQEVDGLPRLIFANSERWAERDAPLFLALEWIEGVTLGERVRSDGPLTLTETLRCASTVAGALAACHEQDVTHRDIKPDNIMLRAGDALQPVLVDFGLSFNQAELDDVTQVEEIGNRFFRLPEHAAEGNARNHASDVTLLTGVVLFCLTQHAPRVPQDEEGRMPHQRPHQQDALTASASGVQLALLNQLFDRAFDTRLERRVQTARELAHALTDIAAGRPVGEDVASQFEALISDPVRTREAELHGRLQQFMMSAQNAVSRLAGDALTQVQSGWAIDPSDDPPYGEVGLSMSPRVNRGPTPAVTRYRFEARGADVVLVVNDEDVWRGRDPADTALDKAVREEAMRAYVQQAQGGGHGEA